MKAAHLRIEVRFECPERLSVSVPSVKYKLKLRLYILILRTACIVLHRLDAELGTLFGGNAFGADGAEEIMSITKKLSKMDDSEVLWINFVGVAVGVAVLKHGPVLDNILSLMAIAVITW